MPSKTLSTPVPAPPATPPATPTGPPARRVRHRMVLASLVLTVGLSACNPLGSLSAFANLKYEPPARLATIARVWATDWLYDRGRAVGVSRLRTEVAGQADGWQWSPACVLSQAFCAYVGYISNRFPSDVRTRGDFWEAISQAHSGRDCFTWSFTVPSSGNFTTRDSGNSHCTP